MRFKPRTDLERVYDMVNGYKYGLARKDVLDKQLKNLVGFKSSVNEISEQVVKTNNENSNMVNETNNKINEVYKKMLQKNEEDKKNSKKNYEKLKNSIKKLEELYSTASLNSNNNLKGELSESDLRCLAELTKRISDLEKQMKMLYHGLNISKFKEDIAKLENDLMQKIDEKDFYELNTKVSLNIAKMNNLQESLERSLELGNKNSKDLNFFLRKLETVNASVIAFKAALEALSGVKSESIFDPSRYIDISTFNDFIKAYGKDVEKIEKNIEDVRKLINEITAALRNKASGEDLKTFEGILNNKLAEMKLLNIRKFSDKIDTNKSFKYIDAQIKHLTSFIVKKNEKNESWLLAKKPIGGHVCASCEAYIGDLKEKEDITIWNKYPHRNKDKNYRIGNGFSHMLNMLNVEMKMPENYNTNKEYNESDEESHKSPILGTNNLNKTVTKMNMINTGGFNNFNRSNFLPKIGKNDENLNMTGETGDKNNMEQGTQGMSQLNSNDEYNINNIDKQLQPHIVKVYRKNKFSAPDITKAEDL